MKIRRSNERGHTSLGWLDSYHTFSFAQFHDPRWMGFRSLRVINDDLVLPGRGFGTHPHRDMEIITYVLGGSLEHRDTMGNRRVLRSGDIQYMSAGSGIRHSEFNPSSEEAVRFLQIWIEPDARGVAPRYEERPAAEAPGPGLRLVASKSGRDGSVSIHQDADLWIGRLLPGQAATHAVARGRSAWIHVAEGGVVIGDQTLGAGDAAALGPGSTAMTATGTSRILLFDLN